MVYFWEEFIKIRPFVAMASLLSGRILTGHDKVILFEDQLQAFCGTPHCQVTPRGTVECGKAQHSADFSEILNGMFMAPLNVSCAHVLQQQLCIVQPPGDFELSLQVSVACHAMGQPEWVAMKTLMFSTAGPSSSFSWWIIVRAE